MEEPKGEAMAESAADKRKKKMDEFLASIEY